MMRYLRTFIVSATMLTSLSACTYIKSLFPDKEKDYQYTTEIAPLILPEDLKSNAIPSLTSQVQAQINSEPTPTISPDLSKPEITSTTSLNNHDSESNTDTTTTPISLIEKQNELEINAPLARSWRLINKVLSRKAIEIIDRNQESKTFTVHFNADDQKPENDSYWHKTINFFDDLKPRNDIYLIKLLDNQQQSTKVSITDEQEKTFNDSSSSQLLQVIKEALKEDLSK
jgi:Uncharacterized lipoprotein